jgi:HemY protein
VLRDAWSEAPHPELAEAWAAFEPAESPAERRRRFRDLIGSNADHLESRLLDAELALADGDLPAARRALGTLPSDEPNQRTLALMGAVERAAGSADAVVRGYLAKAVSAPRGPHWHCDRCGATPVGWTAVCPSCGGFDTLGWRARGEATGDGTAMLPLLMDAAGSP